MVSLKINGRKIKAEEGMTILQAARANDIEIPTLCSNDALKPYGACRLCVVEIEKNGRTTVDTSCTYPVGEGLEVKTHTPRVMDARKMVLELHLARCPNVSIVQELAAEYGVTESSRQMGKDNEYCILCGLCVRACNEVVKAGAIQFAGRGPGKVVDSPFGKPADDCIACGSCAFICPTGVIPYWEKDGVRTIWGRDFELQPCNVCGNYIAPKAQLEHWARITGDPVETFFVCKDCR